MRLRPGYNEKLARHDPELRMRWSVRRHVWLLERRARYSRLPVDPAKYGFAEHDTIVQLRDGYFTLGQYPAQELPSVDHLIAYLRTQDSRRRGTQDLGALANSVAEELDALDAAREERLRQQALGDIAARGGEFWEHAKWAEGTRVAVPATLR